MLSGLVVGVVIWNLEVQSSNTNNNNKVPSLFLIWSLLATKTNFVTKMLHLAMKKKFRHQNCHLATKNSVVKVCHTLCVKLWAANFAVLETNLIGRERLSLL